MFKHINKLKYFYIFCVMPVLFLTGCRDNGHTVIITEENVSSECEDDTDLSLLVASEETDMFESEQELVSVYVCGAVVSPGVYELESTAIKNTALMIAGGYADGAATTYVNLAEPIEAGEKIYFPYEEELVVGDLTQDISYQDETSDKININKASKEELMTLSGIGESKAEDIIAYREEHGGFNSIEEIMNINGIKEGVYNKIKDSIVVN